MNEHDFYKEITNQMVADMEQIEKRCRQKDKVVKMKKRKTVNKKLVGIIAAATCAVIIGMPVMAKGLSKLWNTTIAENNGVTVTLTQTFTDKYCMYIYLTVKTDGTIPLTDENLFDDTVLSVDGKKWNKFTNFSGGFVDDKYAVSDFERTYELIYMNSGNEINLNNHDIQLEFTNLLADAGKLEMYSVADGTWSLAWKVAGEYSGETKTIDLENTLIKAQSGGTYTLDSIDISPISYNVHYQNQGVDSFEEGPLHVAFIMNDGTIYDDETAYSEEFMLAGNGGSTNIDGEFMGFVKILDLSELAAVRINGTVFDLN